MPKKSPIDNILQWLMLVLLCAPLFFAPIVMIKYAVGYPENFSFAEAPIVFATIALYFICFRFIAFKAFSDKALLLVGFAVANVAMFVSLVSFDTEPCSDYKVIYNLACDMVNGDYDASALSPCNYLYIYNYQIGIASFISLIFRLFGINMLILQIFCLLLINLTLWLTYRIARKLCGSRAAVFSLLLFASFYPVLVTVNQFTNQHIALPLILLALECISSRKWYLWASAGAITAVMNFLRSEGIIIIATALLYAIILICKERKQPSLLKSNILNILLLLAIYVFVQKGFDTLMQSADYYDGCISKNNVPYFKFHKGLTGYDQPEVYNFDCDVDSFNIWERQQVVDAVVKSPASTAAYVSNKMIRYLGEFDWKFENTYNHDSKYTLTYPVKAFVMFGWGQYLVVVFLALFGFYFWRKSHLIDQYQIYYIGITTVYFLIEAFSSYRYESYPILFIFAGFGLLHLLGKFQNNG